MRITHLCLSGPVTDGWSYQENLISKYHVKLGYDVSIICSEYVWNSEGKLIKDEKDDYVNLDGVHIYRLSIRGKDDFYRKFKRYNDLYTTLEKTNPDVLFIHGCQFMDVDDVIKYIKCHKDIRVFADNHADYSNSASSWISKNFLHKVIWKHCAHKINPFVEKWYGVLPARVDFLKYAYRIPAEKIELLVMGSDDEKVAQALVPECRHEIRAKYGISDDDFLIMTGGKIDMAKQQTLLLMDAVNRIENQNVKLIVFGSVVPELKDRVIEKCSNRVQYIGWVQSEDSYKYFAAADLVAFPGRHSVFWEQVAGLGIPMICKLWDGTTHVDVGGNVIFLKQDTTGEIFDVISNLVNNSDAYNKMKNVAENGMNQFSYTYIAKKSIGEV